MLKRILLGVAALLGALVIALLVGTVSSRSRQMVVPPLPVLAVDKEAAAASLAVAIRAKTVSGLLDPAGTGREFEALHEHLRQRYPLVHTRLEREVVGAHSLLYTWKGSDPALKPIALAPHQDVVPIAPGTETLWKHPPFDGVVTGGEVWGRGAWDDKANLVSQFEAVETLLKAGFQPRRTVYLILGHDEEVGGAQGAAKVAALFKQRNVRLETFLTEGLVVTQGILPGVAAPIALIGVAEKGYVSLRLSAQAPPGHSSMPPAPGQSAIGMLSAALVRLDQNPLPGGIRGVASDMFGAVAPEMSGFQRVALANVWLFRPLLERMLSAQPSTNALMRTTTALTIAQAGNKENVLPGRADAVVNFRILPGDTVAGVVAHVKRVVADERVAVEPLGEGGEASPVSSSSGPGYQHIERAIREVFAGALVAPGLMLAGTDAKHFVGLADQIYRFTPVRAGPADLSRPHGTDERLSVDNLAEMIRFYHRLLQLAAGTPTTSQPEGKQP
ncbi:MAG: M20 family peptidase [Burkholderiales bacterium]|nr:M20 family peptidase [Burkholderiales bacterium]